MKIVVLRHIFVEKWYFIFRIDEESSKNSIYF